MGQNRAKFENIYVTYYSRMKRYAQEYVISEEDAENIAQDVFLDLWEQRYVVISHDNITAFLFTVTKNRCLDFLRHKIVIKKGVEKIRTEHNIELQMKMQSLEAFDDKVFSEPDIENIVYNAIEMLPERCREIFVMNKFKGIKQKTIASMLNISIHTVESQMSIAIKKLKYALKDYLSFFLFLFI